MISTKKITIYFLFMLASVSVLNAGDYEDPITNEGRREMARLRLEEAHQSQRLAELKNLHLAYCSVQHTAIRLKVAKATLFEKVRLLQELQDKNYLTSDSVKQAEVQSIKEKASRGISKIEERQNYIQEQLKLIEEKIDQIQIK